MSVKRGNDFLSVPGPTNIPYQILNAMNRPAIDFSGPEFIATSKACLSDVRRLFRTESMVFVYSANGHGAWEAALSNTLSPGDKALVPQTGNFSASWQDMAEALGIIIEITENDWRHAIDPELVRERLAADTNHEIKAVLMVHTDTATSVTSDIPAMRAAMDAAKHPALLVVDTIASLGTVEFRMDDWGVDVAIAASQKGLMMPPGLGLVAASPKALKASENTTMPRRYWDWISRMDTQHYRAFCGTAPEHMIFGLCESIRMLDEETMEGAFARHARLAEAVRRAVGVWAEGSDGAIELNALVPAERANSVTTIRFGEGIDGIRFRETVRERFQVSLGGGLGMMFGKAFRIGHMGNLNEPMVLATLSAAEASLGICGIPHGRGGILAAMDWFAETSGGPVEVQR
ncbi:MAG: aminotransferase class V-fold PLP-dependent enzyme [Rhodospirillaceae bacterium]|nr:aminotransferase class V-fold PLP-dependent enzyme [Rhodospirillaceae bacterium]MBT6137297.1 aminotransferase class V-fold PLP-dependent enzyme [Rhodospirillaceae bacterium]